MDFTTLAAFRAAVLAAAGEPSLRFLLDNGQEHSLSLAGSEMGPALLVDGLPVDPAAVAEPAPGLFFLTFDLSAAPRVNVTLLPDLSEGLVTAVIARQGENPRRPTAISVRVEIGSVPLPGRPENERRPGYTNRLSGKAIRWIYSDGFSIDHLYISERYYRIRLLQKLGDPDSPYELAMRPYTDRTEPALYLQLRPELILFGFTEENMDRVTGPEISCSSRLQVIDLQVLETVGRGFGPPGAPVDRYRARGAWVSATPAELDPHSVYYI